MAKNDPILRTNSVIVHISSIAWFREWNLARQSGNYGNTEDLKKSLIADGWRDTGDGTIDVEPITDDYRKRAMSERAEKWESLKTTAAADSSQLVTLRTWEEIYTEKGKLREVHYIGVSGNRRSDVYFGAMVERKKLNESVTPEIPVVVKTFKDPLDRLDVQIGENVGKLVGFMDMTSLDKLRAAKKAVEFGASQARLRKTFKDGTGQKLWGVLLLDKRFPNLNIYHRMVNLPPEDPAHIKFGNQKTTELSEMLLRSDSEELEKHNRKIVNKLSPLTEEEVATYFGTVRPTGNDPKILKRENIKNLSESFPALPLRAAFKAVMNASTDGLKPYDNASMGLNAIDQLIGEGDYPPAEFLLLKIVSTPKDQRVELYKRLHAALEVANNGHEAKKPAHAAKA